MQNNIDQETDQDSQQQTDEPVEAGNPESLAEAWYDLSDSAELGDSVKQEEEPEENEGEPEEKEKEGEFKGELLEVSEDKYIKIGDEYVSTKDLALSGMLKENYKNEKHSLDERLEEFEQQKLALSEEHHKKILEVEAISKELSDSYASLSSMDLTELEIYAPEEAEKIKAASEAIQSNSEKARLALNEYEQKKKQIEVENQARMLTKYIPEWVDSDQMKSDFSEIKDYLKKNGFDDSEIEAISSAKQIAAYRDAAKYRKLMDKAKKSVKGSLEKAKVSASGRAKTKKTKTNPLDLWYGQ